MRGIFRRSKKPERFRMPPVGHRDLQAVLYSPWIMLSGANKNFTQQIYSIRKSVRVGADRRDGAFSWRCAETAKK